MALLRPLVSHLMRRDLRTAFRRVCWVGAWPRLPEAPVVLYATHHSFYDGYLLWLLVTQHLHRPVMTWMEDWDRFPFFAVQHALPFPRDDPKRRAMTIRRTVRQFREQPDTVLVYFPEGRLHAQDEGVLPFTSAPLYRLARVLDDAYWWPVALRATWWGEALPTALLTGGAPAAGINGSEADRLAALWRMLCDVRPGEGRLLLEGRTGPAEHWNFSFLKPFFARRL